jgi:hypothetical protein
VSVLLALAAPAVATPVATSDEAYSAFGRVFPDPHGCNKASTIEQRLIIRRSVVRIHPGPSSSVVTAARARGTMT